MKSAPTMMLQSVRWVAEAREPDGTWRLIRGPGTVSDVIRAVRQWRATGWGADAETRVRLI